VDDVAIWTNNNLSTKISYSKKSVNKHNETISNDNTDIIKNSIDMSNIVAIMILVFLNSINIRLASLFLHLAHFYY
jgi:hypothetical protein